MKFLTKLYEISPVLFWTVWTIIYCSLGLLGLAITFAMGKWAYNLIF